MNKIDLMSYIRQTQVKPEKIDVFVSLETTGLTDPRAVEISFCVLYGYNENSIDERFKNLNALHGRNHFFVSEFKHSLLNPDKKMEEGATKANGITDDDLRNFGTDFVKSEVFDFYKRLADASLPVTINFANSFAMNVFNEELKRAGMQGLYEFRVDELKYEKKIDGKNDNIVVRSLDDLAMREYSKEIATFSLANIEKAVGARMGHANGFEYQENLFLSEAQVRLDKIPSERETAIARASFEKVKKIADITDTVLYANSLAQIDFIKENKGLDYFPFRRAGKQIINDLRDVSIRHIHAILSKTNEGKGVATLCTLRDAILKSKEVEEFCLDNAIKDRFAGFIKACEAQGLISMDNLDEGNSALFKKFVIANRLKDDGFAPTPVKAVGMLEALRNVSEKLKADGMGI